MIRSWVINVAVLAVVMSAGVACVTVDFYNDGTIQNGRGISLGVFVKLRRDRSLGCVFGVNQGFL